MDKLTHRYNKKNNIWQIMSKERCRVSEKENANWIFISVKGERDRDVLALLYSLRREIRYPYLRARTDPCSWELEHNLDLVS